MHSDNGFELAAFDYPTFHLEAPVNVFGTLLKKIDCPFETENLRFSSTFARISRLPAVQISRDKERPLEFLFGQQESGVKFRGSMLRHGLGTKNTDFADKNRYNS